MLERITQTINKIEQLIQEQLPESKYQFELHDLLSNTKHFRGADESFHWGSVYKLFVVAEIFKMYENGMLDLESKVQLNKDYNKGVGFIRFLDDLKMMSVRDMCKVLIATSDNVCADMLMDIVTIERLNELFSKAECNNSKITDNLYSIISLIFSDKHQYFDVDYIHSTEFYENFECQLNNLITRNHTTVKDINKLLYFVLMKYINNTSSFLNLIDVPNVHSRFNQYMGFNHQIGFIGKTGTLGFGIVSNETAIIYDKQTNEILGYFSILTRGNRKRIYQSFDTLALIAIRLGKLYEQLIEIKN